MQYIIEVSPEQDLQFLLKFLEKMQVVYRPVELPKKVAKKAVKKAPAPGSRASRFRGKLSAETADALQKYVEQSRNEWERTF